MFPQQKCCISCVGGMQDRKHVHTQHVGESCDNEDCMGKKKISIPEEKSGKWRRPTEKLLNVMPLWAMALHQTALGWVVEKNLRCIRFMKAKNQGETKMIWCLEMYKTHESQEVSRNSDDSVP